MNPRRSIAVLRGLGSLAVTAMLLVGVPLGLAVVTTDLVDSGLR